MVSFPESSERQKFCSEKVISNQLVVGPEHGKGVE